MKKKIISIFLIIFILTSITFASADVKKDETIYVNLDYYGSLIQTRVVNHIYGYGKSDYYTDYGAYTDIRNMVNGIKPSLGKGEVIWPMEALKSGDIYYEGAINKKLPIDVSIKYFLDNNVTSPKELGGKSGHLKIAIRIKYNKDINWSKTNIVTQVQLNPDLDVFSNINTEGNKVVIGKKAMITFVSFPSKDQTLTLEMDGENIYLDPINITLVPSSFNLPDNIKGGLDSLMDGIDKMDDASAKLIKGADSLVSGTEGLNEGMYELDNGIEKLYLGSSNLSSGSNSLSTGMDEFHKGLNEMANQGNQLIDGINQVSFGMGVLSTKGNELYDGLDKLHIGLKRTNSGTKDLTAGYNELYKNHNELAKLAKIYASSSDPMVRMMAEGIIKEGEAMKELNSGLNETSNGLDELEKGTEQLKTGFGEYKEGITQMKESIDKAKPNIEMLPYAISQMDKSFKALSDGINKYFGGVNELSKGLKLMHENTKQLPQNIKKLLNGQVQLRDGITSLGSGITKINSELDENINISLLSNKENSYKSFVNNDKNKNSTVQFIMRTPPIERPVEKKVYTKAPEVKQSFIDRLLALFKK